MIHVFGVAVIVLGLVAVACALLRRPVVADPNELAPWDRLTDPLEGDDPDLPYGAWGP